MLSRPDPLFATVASALTKLANPESFMQTSAMTDLDILEQQERILVNALLRRDKAALDEIWDTAFVFTDPDGRILSRNDCINQLASGSLAIKEARLLRTQVQVFGDTGVVTGLIALRGQAGEMRYDGEYSFLDVYARRDGRWRVVLSSGERARALLSNPTGVA